MRSSRNTEPVEGSEAASSHNELFGQELQSLCGLARTHADVAEKERELDSAFFAPLVESQVLRCLVPTAMGGAGGSLHDWFRISTTLSHADASAGWAVAHGSMLNAIISACADDKLRSEFFGNASNVIAATNLGSAKFEERPDGLVVSGRWAFATSCTHATFVGGMIRRKIDGNVVLQTVIVPVEEAQIERNWDPIGLAGTGSHNLIIDNVFVPFARIIDWPRPRISAINEGRSGINPCLALSSGTWPLAISCAATYIGLSRRALDEVKGILAQRRDSYTGAAATENAAVLRNYESAEAKYLVSRLAMESVLDSAWSQAESSGSVDDDTAMQLRLTAVSAVHQCHDVVRTAYSLAGASALSRQGVLERLYRDASCLTSHVSANPASFEITGRARFGLADARWV